MYVLVQHGLTAWWSNLSPGFPWQIVFHQLHRADNSSQCRLKPEIFQDFSLKHNILRVYCELAHHWSHALLKCNEQHCPTSTSKLGHRSLTTHLGQAHSRATCTPGTWRRTGHTSLYLDGVPPANAPLNTRPSSTLRLALVLVNGLALAVS